MKTPSVDSRVYVSLEDLIALRSQVNYRSFLLRHKVVQNLPGESRSNTLGQGIEFSEIRAYQAGDDIRAIDWRALARSGKTYSRLFSEERERQMHILVDQRAPMFFGSRIQFKSVLAAKLAAANIWAALDNGFRISGQISGESEVQFKTRSTRQSAIDIISNTTQQNHSLSVNSALTRSLAAMLANCLSNTTRGSHITVISDFHDLDDNARHLLAAISRQRHLLLVVVFDPVEKTLPLNRLLGISDGTKRQQMNISRRIRNQHVDTYVERMNSLRETATAVNASLRFTSTHDDWHLPMEQAI